MGSRELSHRCPDLPVSAATQIGFHFGHQFMDFLKPSVLAACLAVLAPWSTAAFAADLEVAIHNAPAAPARMFVALFDSAESMGANKPVKSRIVDIGSRPTLVHFAGLDAGSYAFSVFADENANGKLDTNLVGMPTERYGFSNDATGFMGPPGFSAAAVRLDGSDRKISITLQ